VGPIGHTVISSAVGGGVWVATGSIAAAAVAVGVGVLMDVDHLLDYYQRFAKGKHDKIYVLFHGWEYSLAGLGVLALFFQPPIFIAAVLAHLAHVITDQWHNGFSRFGYSITFRAIKGFNVAAIAPDRNRLARGRKHSGRYSAERLIESACRRVFQRWSKIQTNEKPSDEPAAPKIDD